MKERGEEIMWLGNENLARWVGIGISERGRRKRVGKWKRERKKRERVLIPSAQACEEVEREKVLVRN